VNQVLLSKEAVRLFRKLPAAARRLLKEGIRENLVEGDPLATTRNKFRLRRPSPHAEFELRIENWRVFYRVRADVIEIVLVGEKQGNTLLIGGEEIEL